MLNYEMTYAEWHELPSQLMVVPAFNRPDCKLPMIEVKFAGGSIVNFPMHNVVNYYNACMGRAEFHFLHECCKAFSSKWMDLILAGLKAEGKEKDYAEMSAYSAKAVPFEVLKQNAGKLDKGEYRAFVIPNA